MNDGARLAAFGVGALALFGAAVGVGRAVGPIGGDETEPHGTGHATTTSVVVGVGAGDGNDAPAGSTHPVGHGPGATHPAGHEDGQP